MLDDDNMELDEDLDEKSSESSATKRPPKEEKQKSTISADLIRGHINTIILRTLSERDKYGYEIIDEIERKSHGQYELKQPTLYSALKRLENQGYIKAYWKTDEISAGGRRKYFTLTDSGKEITEKNRAEWEYSRTVIDNLISDQAFDFNNPAPNPVDFKILKQSTSRVPTVKLEETNGKTSKRDSEPDEEKETIVSYSFSDFNDSAINVDASQLQFNNEPQENDESWIEAPPPIEDSQPDVMEQPIAKQPQPEVAAQPIVEQPQSEEESQPIIEQSQPEVAAQPIVEQPQPEVVVSQPVADQSQAEVRVKIIIEQPQPEVVVQPAVGQPQPEQTQSEVAGNTYTQSENIFNDEMVAQQQEFERQYQPPQPEEYNEQFYGSEIKEQDAAYFRSDSIENTYGDLYDKPAERYEQPDEQPAPSPSFNREPERLSTDSDQYKKLHENYLKLIDDNYAGNGKRKKQSEYGDNLDTDKLIYINKPETERDYKNLINDMYAQTIKPQNTNANTNTPPVYEPEPEQYTEPTPPPVVEQREPVYAPVYIERSEEARRAESDGLRIFTSDKQPKPNGKYTRNFNLGYALFKSAAVTFVYMMIIFVITILCRTTLDVTLAYPFVIFALACIVFAVNAIMALSGYGRNSAKPVTHGYVGVCIVLTVIAILIVCVLSILLNVDFASGADICKKIVIPSVTLLAAPLFAVMFYLFSR